MNLFLVMASSSRKSILHMKPASALHLTLAAAGGTYPAEKKATYSTEITWKLITEVNFKD